MNHVPHFNQTIAELANNAKAWPFVEARNLVKRLEAQSDDSEKEVIFETGYGPSGLPHIGTFGEVVRTRIFNNISEDT